MLNTKAPHLSYTKITALWLAKQAKASWESGKISRLHFITPRPKKKICSSQHCRTVLFAVIKAAIPPCKRRNTINTPEGRKLHKRMK